MNLNYNPCKIKFSSSSSLSLSLSLSLSFSVCLSLCVCVSISLSLSLRLSVSVSVSLSQFFSLSLFVSVCLSLCLSLSFSLSASLSLPPSLPRHPPPHPPNPRTYQKTERTKTGDHTFSPSAEEWKTIAPWRRGGFKAVRSRRTPASELECVKQTVIIVSIVSVASRMLISLLALRRPRLFHSSLVCRDKVSKI